jgi:hypothetical protein
MKSQRIGVSITKLKIPDLIIQIFKLATLLNRQNLFVEKLGFDIFDRFYNIGLILGFKKPRNHQMRVNKDGLIQFTEQNKVRKYHKKYLDLDLK